ncbi:MAG TPA: hypothetical protein VG028_06075 [Terriglobia bacterium]|nr:hypothetical protein [Terriglobia bacterium]
MRTRTILLITFLAGALAGPALVAQDQKDAAKPNEGRFGDPNSIGRGIQGDLYGVVKSVKQGEIVLDKTKFGVDQTIKLEPKTKYVRNGKSSSWAKLEVGDPIYVDIKTDKKTKVMIAKKVISGVVATP